jgi:hypothetical protein
LFSLTAGLCLLTLALPTARAAESIGSDGALCRFQTEKQGRMTGMPANLLTAISFVESGRWDPDRREKTAWPWTVTSGGEGHFYRSKQEAIAAVKKLQSKGVRNIDVGCMQINLYYHGEAFPTLNEAFDPGANVAYAVSFLEALHRETKSWETAATRYHSATPEYANRYRGKINAELASLNGDGGAGALSDSAPLRGPDGRFLSDDQRLSIQRRALEVAKTKAEEEFARAQAKAFADSWRAEKLAEYQRAKRERQEALERARRGQ